MNLAVILSFLATGIPPGIFSRSLHSGNRLTIRNPSPWTFKEKGSITGIKGDDFVDFEAIKDELLPRANPYFGNNGNGADPYVTYPGFSIPVGELAVIPGAPLNELQRYNKPYVGNNVAFPDLTYPGSPILIGGRKDMSLNTLNPLNARQNGNGNTGIYWGMGMDINPSIIFTNSMKIPLGAEVSGSFAIKNRTSNQIGFTHTGVISLPGETKKRPLISSKGQEKLHRGLNPINGAKKGQGVNRQNFHPLFNWLQYPPQTRTIRDITATPTYYGMPQKSIRQLHPFILKSAKMPIRGSHQYWPQNIAGRNNMDDIAHLQAYRSYDDAFEMPKKPKTARMDTAPSFLKPNQDMRVRGGEMNSSEMNKQRSRQYWPQRVR